MVGALPEYAPAFRTERKDIRIFIDEWSDHVLSLLLWKGPQNCVALDTSGIRFRLPLEIELFKDLLNLL